MPAAARFRAMKAVGTVVAPTDTVVAQFSRPRRPSLKYVNKKYIIPSFTDSQGESNKRGYYYQKTADEPYDQNDVEEYFQP